MRNVRPIALLFGVGALLGLAGLLTYLGFIVAKHAAGVELENDTFGWFVIALGIYGGMAALFLVPLTFAFWRKPR